LSIQNGGVRYPSANYVTRWQAAIHLNLLTPLFREDKRSSYRAFSIRIEQSMNVKLEIQAAGKWAYLPFSQDKGLSL